MKKGVLCLALRVCLLVLLPTFPEAMADVNDVSDRLHATVKDGKIEATFTLKRGESIYVAYKSDDPDLNRCIMAVTNPSDAPLSTCNGRFSLSMQMNGSDSNLNSEYKFDHPTVKGVYFIGAFGKGWAQPVPSKTQFASPVVKFEPSLLNPEFSDVSSSDLAEARITFKDQSQARIIVEVWVTKNLALLQSRVQKDHSNWRVSFNLLRWDVSVPKIQPASRPQP